MLCSNCGNEVKEGSKFCAFCGTPVTAPVEEQPVFTAPVEGSPVAVPVEEAPAVAASVEDQPVAVPVEEAPVAASVEEQSAATPMQDVQQPGIPMPGVQPMQGWQQPGAPMPGAQPSGTPMPGMQPMQGWQQSGASMPGAQPSGAPMPGVQPSGTPMPGMQPGAPTQNWQPAVPPPVQDKKKSKAGLIIGIVALVLVLVGGGVGAFLVLGNNPVKKIEKAFAADDIDTAIELYEKVKSEKDIEKVQELARNYAQQTVDSYINEEIDYYDATDVLDELASSILRRDDDLWSMAEQVDRIWFSRDSFEEAEGYRESGDYLWALSYYEDVIKEDTAYYDRAQQAIEEVKGLYRDEVLSDAQYYVDNGDYDMAESLLEDALYEIGDDAEISEALDNVVNARAQAQEQAAAQASRDMEKIAGTWGMEIDMGSYMASELGEGFEDFDGSFILSVLMEFKTDGTYRMYVDADSFTANFDQWLDEFVAYSVEMMYEEFEKQGVSRSEADELMDESFGSTMEEYLDDMMSYYLDYDELLENMDSSGNYMLDGNKICWDEYGSYDIFSVSGDTLTIEEPEGSYGEEIFPGVTYPLVFTRVQ